MKKRVLPLLLALTLCLGLIAPSFAADEYQRYDWTFSPGERTTLSGLDSVWTHSGQEISPRSLTSFSIPDRVTSGNRIPVVVQNLFRDWEKLESVSMPSTIVSIGPTTFLNCTRLRSVTFRGGNRVTSIGLEAFANCTSLTSAPLADGLTSIGDSAFQGCTGLTSVTIPATVTAIGNNAFKGCTNLRTVVFEGTRAQWDRINPTGAFESSANITCTGTAEPPGKGEGYTVYFDGNGGSVLSYIDSEGIPDSSRMKAVIYGQRYGRLPDAYLQGRTFYGWYTAPKGGTKITADSIVSLTRNQTLYAHWEEDAPPVSITLTLADTPGSDGVVEISASNTALHARINPAVGAKIGPSAVRLYTQSGQLVKEYPNERTGTVTASPVNLSLPLWDKASGLTAGTVYLYEFSATVDGTAYTSSRGRCRVAGSAQTYTVSFWNPNNVTLVKSVTVTNGKPYGEMPVLSALSGRPFDGWYTADNVKITADTIVNLTRDQQLYAHWKEAAQTTSVHITDTPGSDGVVEINSSNARLNATLEAAKGLVVSQWSVRFYSVNGDYVGGGTNKASATMNGSPYLLYLNLWTTGGTPTIGQVLKYSDELSLTVGTVYQYEFTAVVDGKTYTTERARMRLSGSAPMIAFKDVPDWCKDSVDWAVQRNITNGKAYDQFAPNDTCITAEILTFLYRAAGQPQVSASSQFTDVSDGDYFCKPANWAKSKNLVSGSTLGTHTPCTRATVVTYLWKLAGSPNTAYDGRFRDVSSTASYAQAVAWAAKNNITNGNGDEGLFDPNATCTRGQIVTFLYRAYAK